jgi:putative ATP-binding cassette transporter
VPPLLCTPRFLHGSMGLGRLMQIATSALHMRAQADLMRLIAGRLPGLTPIGIGHRPELLAFHERKLTMESAPAGARIVADEPIARAASKAAAA